MHAALQCYLNVTKSLLNCKFLGIFMLIPIISGFEKYQIQFDSICVFGGFGPWCPGDPAEI